MGEMNLSRALRVSIYLSQAFALISFEVKKVNHRLVFLQSQKRVNLAKINFGIVIILHTLLVVFQTEEITAARDDLTVKIVRFVNLLAFSGGIATMFLTVLRKGKIICEGLNEITNLYVFFGARKRNKSRVKTNIHLFLGTIVNYSVTVLPMMLTALHVQRNKIPKVITYTYYAFSMWLENIFVFHFTTLASFIGETYACVTRVPIQIDMPKVQLYSELRRSRLREKTFKEFIFVLLNVYKYAFFFWICWSFTMVLQFVLKVNLRLRVLVWCFFISYRAIIIIYACSIMKNETKKTAEYLHKLFIDVDDPKICEEVEIYSYQLLHQKLNFNALGFFCLDFPLFHSMVASVATYIVILMQLKNRQTAGH